MALDLAAFARLDPQTGKVTEIKIPVKGARPYDCWPDKEDNIWMPDQIHSILIKYDPKTQKFAYYPMPQPRQSLNKLSVGADNTMWLPTRGMPLVCRCRYRWCRASLGRVTVWPTLQ